MLPTETIGHVRCIELVHELPAEFVADFRITAVWSNAPVPGVLPSVGYFGNFVGGLPDFREPPCLQALVCPAVVTESGDFSYYSHVMSCLCLILSPI